MIELLTIEEITTKNSFKNSDIKSEFCNELLEGLGFEMFWKINETKFGKHSIKKIRVSKDGKIFAGRCNCGKGTYHYIYNNIPDWDNDIPAHTILHLEKLPIRFVAMLVFS